MRAESFDRPAVLRLVASADGARRGGFLRLTVFLIAAVVAGCSSDNVSLTCPGAEIAPDLGAIAQFPPGAGRALSDIQLGGKIRAVATACKREDVGIASTLDITFFAARNNSQLRRGVLPYFVALADSTGTILAKQNFTIPVQFTPTQNAVEFHDNITTHLPVRNVATGDSYAIIIGFQLSAEELAFNREHREQ
jgi:hypothetical protein